MRTQKEIVVRLKARRSYDMLGFETDEYIPYLDFEHAKEFLKDGVTAEEWEPCKASLKPIERLKDYMPFAWEKANGQRGISANRSIMHMMAWLWLAGESELQEKVESEFDNNYHHYGKPILKLICEQLKIDWCNLDDGERSNG